MASCLGLPSLTPARSRPMELISGEGKFDEAGFKDFLDSVELHQAGDYAVVAIVGPQSSGKSTLMNNLFSTNFREMNAERGRRQTTKGIWLQKAPNMERVTIVLDMEGTDGLERGEDDTAFEKQSALFALATADIVLINMWNHDIGREHAGSRPLLKTIFEVMMRIFGQRKTKLLFVIRDTLSKTPFKILESDLRKDVQKIWEAVPKPQGSEDTSLSEIFNVEVIGLSNYDSDPKKFKNEVDQLRRKYFDSTYGTSSKNLAQSRELPFRSANETWDIIKKSKDLDIPAYKVMVATFKCEEIALDKLRLFKSDKDWLSLQERVAIIGFISGFGAKISTILWRFIKEYDSESSIYLVEDVRKARRSHLVSEALKVVHPAYKNILCRLRSDASRAFETQLEEHLSKGTGFAESVRQCHKSCLHQFDRQCSDDATIEQANWDDSSSVRRELINDMDHYALIVRTNKLPQIVDQQRDRLYTELTKKLRRIVNESSINDIWPSIRKVLEKESNAASLALSSGVVMFEPSKAEVEKMVFEMKQYARKKVEERFREETHDLKALMKQRYLAATFKPDCDSDPSDEQDRIMADDKAYYQSLKFLSMAAVIRLDERDDNVESVLIYALMGSGTDSGVDLLGSTSWEKVPLEMTLINPVECREIWNKFKQEMIDHFNSTRKIQEDCKEKNIYGSLTTWAILGVGALGVVGFTVLIRALNIDVWLALTAAGVGCTIALVNGVYVYMDKNVKGLRKKYRKLLKKLKRCILEISRVLMAFIHPMYLVKGLTA